MLKIKVCGLREPQNIEAVAAFKPDFMGFIFYPRSQRYVEVSQELIESLSKLDVKRVGVFVDADFEHIKTTVELLKLDVVQLHGKETPAMIDAVKNLGVEVIKAIPIACKSDFDAALEYQNSDYLLFDTRCMGFGGSGASFDWALLENYCGSAPFLLSGGITESDTESIKRLAHPLLKGVDINSQFEDTPGLKNIEKVRSFVEKMRF